MKESKKYFLVAIVSLVVGVIFTCIFAEVPNATWAVYALFVAFFVFAVAVFGTITSLIDERRSTCRSCKKVMKGAGYEINFLGEVDEGNKQAGCYEVTVQCPFCGEVQSFRHKVTTAWVDNQGRAHYTNGMHATEKYCKQLFRGKKDF